MTQIIDEPTCISPWKLKVELEGDQVRVSIHGPRDGEKAFVRIPAKDLQRAVNRELSWHQPESIKSKEG